MSRKLALALATATICSLLPQFAHASCSGTACSSYTFAYSKFTNKDRDLKIHITGCFIKSGTSCGSPSIDFDVIVDPNSSKPLTPPSSVGSDPKVDVRTASFLGALPQPHVQTLPTADSVMTTINNQTDVPVVVKYRDAENSEFTKDVREHSPTSPFPIRMDPKASSSIKWTALSGSKQCDGGTVTLTSNGTGTIDVTKCTKSCELSMDKRNCEAGVKSKEEEARKRRDQARTDLGNARNEYNSCIATASRSPVKLPLIDPCATAKDKMSKLEIEISNDDKILGETEPGGPARRDTVLDTTPIPAQPAQNPRDKLPKIGGCSPGSPDNPKDIQGGKSGVFNGTTGGCDVKTDVLGGRK
jgi:hypothetical protein